MIIKRFNEKYEMDVHYGEIPEEYAKLIISNYLDKKGDESLESVFADIVTGDNLDDDQIFFVKKSLINCLNSLHIQSKRIREIHEIDAKKYNL